MPAAFNDDLKRVAMDEFCETWMDYESPSRAASIIGGFYGIGRTTLRDWLKDADLWPVLSPVETWTLVMENGRLKQELEPLRGVRQG